LEFKKNKNLNERFLQFYLNFILFSLSIEDSYRMLVSFILLKDSHNGWDLLAIQAGKLGVSHTRKGIPEPPI